MPHDGTCFPGQHSSLGVQEKSAGKGTGKVQKTRRASAVADNDDMSESESEESDEEMVGRGASRKGSAGPARKRLPRAAKGAWMLFDPFIIRIYLILADPLLDHRSASAHACGIGRRRRVMSDERGRVWFARRQCDRPKKKEFSSLSVMAALPLGPHPAAAPSRDFLDENSGCDLLVQRPGERGARRSAR